MNDMKCPFCQQELNHYEPLGLYMCKTCFADCRLGMQDFGTKGLWQELIRTRKALNVAVDALKVLDDDYFPQEINNPARIALEQITALEQKE